MKEMAKYETAQCCGTVLNNKGTCECGEIYVTDEYKCPECGEMIYKCDDYSNDPSMSEYCTNKFCDYTENEFMVWEDIKSNISKQTDMFDCKKRLICCDEVDYSENNIVGVIYYQRNSESYIDILIQDKNTKLCKRYASIIVSNNKLVSPDAMYLIRDKALEWIEENKLACIDIKIIMDIKNELGPVFNEIIENAYKLPKVKESTLNKLVEEMNVAIGKHLNDDCSIDVIVDREKGKFYGSLCSKKNSCRITSEYPLALFLDGEIIDFCEENEYFLELLR